jgi:hypothetical protein
VPVNDRQVGIGILSFGHELRMGVIRLGVGESTLSGAEPDEHELVIFTAF